MSDMAEDEFGGKDGSEDKKPFDGLKDFLDTIRRLEGTEGYKDKQTRRSIENYKKLKDHFTNPPPDFSGGYDKRIRSPMDFLPEVRTDNQAHLQTDNEDFYDEFQQKNASSDVFEFAWGIAKGDNSPTNPSLWSQAKSKARAKFDVYPSAYANAWASKWYKSKGGGWKKKSKKGKK